jgi:hypothetical protein
MFRHSRLTLALGWLIVLLQRAPLLRVASSWGDPVAPTRIVALLRAWAGAVASLGAVHSLAGASAGNSITFSITSNPIRTSVGGDVSVLASVKVPNGQYVNSWKITGALPPGLRINPGGTVTANSTVINVPPTNPGYLQILGTPLAAGSYSILISAWEGPNATLSGSLEYTVMFDIAQGSLAVPVFTQQPASQTVNVGGSVTFSAAASGAPTPTFQWTKNGNPLIGQTNATLTLNGVVANDAGTYAVTATNSLTTATSTPATLTVMTVLPTITTQPAAQTVATGSTAVLNVGAANASAYQWRRNGSPIPGATSSSLVLTGASATAAGAYTVLVTGPGGSVTSAAANLAVVDAADFGHLFNLSINTTLAAGGSFTMGYVVGGAVGTKPLVVRAVGPGLAAFGVPGTLPDPKFELYSGSTLTGANDNWGGGAALGSAFNAVGAFALPGSSLDAAALTNLAAPSNGSTVVVSGGAGAGGLVLAEIYDATATFTPSTPRLINVSVNKAMTAGEKLIAGFVISGSTARTVLVRAVGPGLAAFGVGGAMVDPSLALYSGQTKIAENDNWGGDAQVAAAFSQVGAFGLPTASKDAVLLLTLAPGAYTAQVAGTGAGLALVEVYEVP